MRLGAPNTRAHACTRADPLSRSTFLRLSCRDRLSIYLCISLFLSLSLAYTHLDPPWNLRDIGATQSATLRSQLGRGGAPGDVTLPPFCLVTSTERHRATGRVPYSSVLPHWLLLLPQTGCRAGLPTSLFSIRDFGGISL